MRHRHLENKGYTLAAIDSTIGRGSRSERATLLAAVNQDRNLAVRVAELCRARLARPDPEFFDRDLYQKFLERIESSQ